MELLIRLKDELKRLKNKKLKPFSKYLYKRLGLTANYLTFLSFTSGLLSVYFLFESHLIFVIFMLISLIFDVLDGAVSRVDHSKGKGWWLDVASDRSITLLILLKTFIQFEYRVLLPTLVLYVLVTGLIAYSTLRLHKETKYVLNAPIFYFLYFLTFYKEGIYVLLLFLGLSLIWIMAQMREIKD